jgi:hypothetical protein
MFADGEYLMESEQVSGLNGHSQFVPKLVHEVKRADDKLVTFVRERPVVAVCAAMALGYMIGRIFTRID